MARSISIQSMSPVYKYILALPHLVVIQSASRKALSKILLPAYPLFGGILLCIKIGRVVTITISTVLCLLLLLFCYYYYYYYYGVIFFFWNKEKSMLCGYLIFWGGHIDMQKAKGLENFLFNLEIVESFVMNFEVSIRVVIKISSCWVNAVKQAGNQSTRDFNLFYFSSIFQ